MRIEFQKLGKSRKVDLFHRDLPKPPREKAIRYYILDKDVEKLSLFLQDLMLEGFPIDKAFKLMLNRLDTKDWTGI